MGYSELQNAVVLQAVNDYVKMLTICAKLKIYNPNDYYMEKSKTEFYKDKYSDTSILGILKNGMDAKEFLKDHNRLQFYTELNGDYLIEVAEWKANTQKAAKSSNGIMNKRKLVNT